MAISSQTVYLFITFALLLLGFGNLQNSLMLLFIIISKVTPLYEGEAVATVGWLWNNIGTVHVNPGRRYIDYNNTLDCLNVAHVRL